MSNVVELPTLEIPAIAELARLNNWVCWKTVSRDNSPTKVPVNPKTGRNASAANPETWGSFREACQCFVMSDALSGVGFVFDKTNRIVGIDLDKCRDPATGVIAEWAMEIINTINSYTEISPSGRGLHIYCKADLPGKSRRTSGIEVYNHQRYFTVTGNHLPGTPEELRERTHEIEQIYFKKLAAAPKKHVDTTPAALASDPRLQKLTDDLHNHCIAEAVAPQKIGALFENVKKVERLWGRVTINEEEEKWSQSEWDLALANHFLDAGWTPVEIMRALIEHRRKHGIDAKLRADYYARTILAAHRGREREAALKELAIASKESKVANRQVFLESLSNVVGVPIKRIIKYVGDQPSYKIVTPFGTASGDIKMLSGQQSFREAIMNAAGKVLDPIKPKKWLEITQYILNAVEEEYVSEEMTAKGQMMAYIEGYLDDREGITTKPNEIDEAIGRGAPFVKNDTLFIVSRDFQRFMRRNLGIYMTAKQLGISMREVGAIWRVVTFQKSGKMTSTTAWQLPRKYLYHSVWDRQHDSEDGDSGPSAQRGDQPEADNGDGVEQSSPVPGDDGVDTVH